MRRHARTPSALLAMEKSTLPLTLQIDFDTRAALITHLQQRQNVPMPDEIATSSASSFRPLGEISQAPNSFDQFMERNQKNLIILAVLIALVAVGFVIHRGIKRSAEQSGGEALSSAVEANALKAVISDHPGTIAAGSAQVLLADKQWEDGQKDDAITTLKKFIADSPSHPALPTAEANLGAKLAAMGKGEEATQVFEKLAGKSPSFITPYALVSLGDLARSSGQIEKAEGYYKRVQTDFAESPFVSQATQRLGSLKAKPPVEIEAPATLSPASEVPEMNFSSPTSPSLQLPFESPASPAQNGTAPATPGQP